MSGIAYMRKVQPFSAYATYVQINHRAFIEVGGLLALMKFRLHSTTFESVGRSTYEKKLVPGNFNTCHLFYCSHGSG